MAETPQQADKATKELSKETVIYKLPVWGGGGGGGGEGCIVRRLYRHYILTI